MILSQDKEVLDNLLVRYAEISEILSKTKVEDFFDLVIENNQTVYDLDLDDLTDLYNAEDISNLENAGKNTEVQNAIQKALSLNIDDNFIIEEFAASFIEAFKSLRTKQSTTFPNQKIQTFCFVFDHLPTLFLSAYGTREYEVFKESKYIKLNYEDLSIELFGELNLTQTWSDFNDLEIVLEKLQIDEMFWDSKLYNCLRDAFHLRAYILINRAFDYNKKLLLNSLNVQFPLYVFAGEHDCEKQLILKLNKS